MFVRLVGPAMSGPRHGRRPHRGLGCCGRHRGRFGLVAKLAERTTAAPRGWRGYVAADRRRPERGPTPSTQNVGGSRKAALAEAPIRRLLVGDRKVGDLRLVDHQGAGRTVTVLLVPIFGAK